MSNEGARAAQLRAIAAGKAAPIPYDGHMGFRLASWSPDGAIVEADVDGGRFANPTGVVHGGVLMGLADSAMGLTVTGLLDEGQAGTNTDLQMRFLRPTKGGRLRATARVVRRGRRTLVLECDVADGEGRLLARASSGFLVLDAKDFAQG